MTQQLVASTRRPAPPVTARPEGERRILDAAAGRIITLAYEMALERASWDDILEAIAAAFPRSLVAVWALDTADWRILGSTVRGVGEDSTDCTQPAIAALAADMTPLEIFQSEKLPHVATGRKEQPSRPWNAAADFGAATGTVLARNGSRILVLEIRYGNRREAEAPTRAAAFLRHVGPHLARAIEFSRREGTDANELGEIVNALQFGVLLIDGAMHIHYANRRADEARRAADGPFVGFDSRLRLLDPDIDTDLREIVQRAGQGMRVNGILKLSVPGGKRYQAFVRPWQGKNRRMQLHDAVFDSGPLVLIALHETDQPVDVPVDFLWRSFSLTEAEAKLADALVNGRTLAEVAHEREVSKQTLRNQLVGLMRKTGTRRQSQLVALLTRLSFSAI